MREELLRAGGWHQNNKAWVKFKQPDTGVPSVAVPIPDFENYETDSEVQGLGLIVNDIVDQMRYMIVPGNEEYSQDMLERMLSGLLAARQLDGRYGITRVTAGIQSQLLDKFYKVHHYRYGINTMESHLGARMNGVLAMSRASNGQLRDGNKLRDAQSEVSRAYVALSFFQKLATDYGPKGRNHRDINWVRSQLSPGAINGMFVELGPEVTLLFLNELNSIVKSAWDENLYDPDKPVSTTFFGKDIKFLDAPQFQVGGHNVGASVFQPQDPSTVTGYDVSNLIVNAAASEQGLGMVPRRDQFGQVVFWGTLLTVKAPRTHMADKSLFDRAVDPLLDDKGAIGEYSRLIRDVTQTGKDLTTLVRPSAIPFVINQPTGDPSHSRDDAHSRFAAGLIRTLVPGVPTMEKF